MRSSCDAIATKFSLQLVELDGLLVQPGPLDRERDAVGDELEQLDVVAREPAVA